MTLQPTPYTLPALLTGLIAAGAGVVVLRRRERTPAVFVFILVASAMAVNSLAYAAELAAATLEAKLFWLNVRYVGFGPVPLLALLLALHWGGHERWLTRSRMIALSIVPVATILLAWTNEWHHWIAGPSVLLQRDGFVMRGAESAVGFWVYVLHGYACVAVAVWIYGRAIFSSPVHRQQGMILLLATLVPWGASAIYIVGLSPDPALDVSPAGYAGACILWAWGLTRGSLFDLVPIARDKVFESIVDAVLVVDGDGRVIDKNPAAASLFGRSLAKVPGVRLTEIVGRDMAARIAQGTHGGEIWLLGRWLEVEAAEVRTARSAVAWVITLRDVTSHKRAQATRDEALRLARSAGRARDEFLARMSHEVRSPLHGVIGSADLLLSSELAPPSRRYAAAIVASSRALLAVVDDLLDFSKLDADHLRVDVTTVNARALMEEVAAIFSGPADQKGVRLAVRGDASVLARADAARLRQVLVNLVGNAVKFTESGSIELTMSPIGQLVRFEVADTGIGIPEHAHRDIFEPFVQVGADQPKGHGGTGLGLSISRRLVELMRGEIGVASSPGEGSTFWFTLPRSQETSLAETAPLPDVSRGPRAGRVLLVEDNHVGRMVTSGLLEREGCDVDLARDGHHALELLAGEPCALIITDVRMPGLDGYELTAAIRRGGEAIRAIPVVALTADVFEGARERAFSAGMDGWLAKPVDPADLRRVLDRWVPRRSGLDTEPLRLSALLASQPETMARVLDAFHDSTPQEIAAIRRAAAEGRWEQVREAAHALKGAAVLLGAAELAAACHELSCWEPGNTRPSTLQRLEPAYAAYLHGRASPALERLGQSP